MNNSDLLDHSKIVATSIIENPRLFEIVAYEMQLHPNELASPWDEVYQVALQLHPNTNLTVANISALSRVATAALNGCEPVDTTEGQMRFSAAVVRRESSRKRKISALRKSVAELEQGANPEEVTRKLSLELVHDESSAMRSPKVGEILKRVRMRQTPEVRIRTGIGWLDGATGGGIRNRSFIAVGAPEKGRKTSWLRSMAIYTLRKQVGNQLVPRDDVAVSVMAYENDQEISSADFVAMLAAECVYYRGWSKEQHNGQPLLSFCTADVAEKFMADESLIKPGKLKDAMTYAWQNLSLLNLEILDRSKQNGGIRTLSDLVTHKRRFVAQYPGKQHIMFVDYAQLVRNGGTDYEDMTAFAQTALDLAMEGDGCVFVAASQFSREAKRLKTAKQDGDVMGSKGSASIEEAVHFYFTTEYDPDTAADQLKVTLRRARRGKQGKRQFCDFRIHPESGLILGTQNGDILQGLTLT